MVANGTIASYTRSKILSVAPSMRRMINLTPLTGIEPIIDALGTLLIALIAFFIKNTGQAETLTQLVSQVFVPLGMLIIGGQATSIHVSLNKLKLAPVNAAVVTGNTPTPPPPPPPPPPPVPKAPAAEDYSPLNLDDMVAKAEARIQKDGGTVNDMSRAYYFKEIAEYIDYVTIPKEYRIAEFIRPLQQVPGLVHDGVRQLHQHQDAAHARPVPELL